VSGTDGLLERHPLLADLRPEQVAHLAEIGTLETHPAGAAVVTEGEAGDALYLVLAGALAVIKDGQTLAILGAGEFFGEMCLLEPAPRSATVVTRERTFLFRLSTAALRRLGDREPEAMAKLLTVVVRVLSQRLRRSNQLLASIGQLTDWLAGSLI
jgi:CRP-like cAMP-binding protein